jgi:winged helix DNA-binding protein
MTQVLGQRALNRALLDRQLLLQRRSMPVATAVERLLGLNAQDPNLPYVALQARLDPFAIPDLTTAIEQGEVVRSTMMRATQHLVSVPDFRLIRPVLAPLLRRVQRNTFGRRTTGIDLEALVTDARALLADGRTLTRPELGRELARTRPGADPVALGWTVQYLEPLVHPAPSGTWNVRGATPFADAGWTGVRREATAADVRRMVLRYLAAFGPATVSDARAWSGVSGLREIVEDLDLRVYADERGRVLYDVPDGTLPDPDVPAPVRFLPDFDATLLAHADRTRIMTDEVRRQVCVGPAVAATVLVDGTVAATWTRAGTGIAVHPLRRLSAAERDTVNAEGARLADFLGNEEFRKSAS